MAYWSVYVAPDDNKVLKKKIESIAHQKRWSFSQAVTGLLWEHLIEQREEGDQGAWKKSSMAAFFSDDSEKDTIYDSL